MPALVVLPVLAAATLAWAHWPAPSLPEGAKADSILVLKSERKMIVYANGAPLKEYGIALGGNPVGPKQKEGDSKTPEGKYTLDWRNPQSSFHLSFHISYPDAQDKARASAAGVSPGGDIMIHGNSSAWRTMQGRLQQYADWTDGCIAVTNPEIEELWRIVPDGTPIEIRP